MWMKGKKSWWYFSNNTSQIAECTYDYNGELEKIELNKNKGFVFNINIEGSENVLDEIIDSIKFYNGDGDEVS